MNSSNMHNFIRSVKLIRYLIVWRVNSSLVRLPAYLPTEISTILGHIIANRLSTKEASEWNKTLAVWNENKIDDSRQKRKNVIPEVSWPIEAILFVYPSKVIYGREEFILWELKLFGDSASHSIFLELILPAMEEAGYTSELEWKKGNKIWGKFDIYAVYVAKGLHWEPLVHQGLLDLRYKPSPKQWAEELPFKSKRKFDSIKWITPFNFQGVLSDKDVNIECLNEGPTDNDIPTLQDMLRAMIFRFNQLLTKKRKTTNNIWDILSEEEKLSFQTAAVNAADSIIVSHNLEQPPNDWPGRRIGTQNFSSIPPSIIPYLELASILHIGRQTHFGCGTFMLN